MRTVAFLILAAGLSAPVQTRSQALGFELFGGVVNYQGDLRQKIFTIQGARPSLGIGASYLLNRHFAVRLAVRTGTLAATDRQNRDSALFYRNLSFQTGITDVEAILMYHILNEEESRVNLYAFGGVAGFGYNPFTYDRFGDKRYLQPLGTEGQGLPGYPQTELYSLRQISIPLGVGLQYRVSGHLTLGWEFAFRKTFTDYIDDLSTDYADELDLLFGRGPAAADLSYRGDELFLANPNVPMFMPKGSKRGNPGAKDLYYFTGIRALWTLRPRGTGRNDVSSRKSGIMGCPKW